MKVKGHGLVVVGVYESSDDKNDETKEKFQDALTDLEVGPTK